MRAHRVQRAISFFILVFAATFANPANAADELKIRLAHTLSSQTTAAFVGVDKGFFKKNGVIVELQPVSLNSVIPAAVQSGSADFGYVTPSVFLQSVDGGLDLVAVAEGAISTPETAPGVVIVRPNSDIKTPQDFVGKRVGAPGLGAFLHVIFRDWLIANNVDYKKVTFVEVAFPQQNDVLKGGSVDAMVSADPISERIIAAGTGTALSYFAKSAPNGLAVNVHIATRAWATANIEAIRRYKKGYEEASLFIQQNPEEARQILGKYVKVPPEALARTQIPVYNTEVTERGVGLWIEIMKRQGMLKNPLEFSKLVVK